MFSRALVACMGVMAMRVYSGCQRRLIEMTEVLVMMMLSDSLHLRHHCRICRVAVLRPESCPGVTRCHAAFLSLSDLYPVRTSCLP